MSNLRRIGVAMNMFVGDHDGCYPLFCDGHLKAIGFSDGRLQAEEGRRRLTLRDE